MEYIAICENDYDMFFVINKYRPLTKTPELTIEVMQEIEQAAGIKFTAIVNNSNLGRETTAEDVEASISYADEVSRLAGIPVAFTTVNEEIYEAVNCDKKLPISLFVEQSWQKK